MSTDALLLLLSPGVPLLAALVSPALPRPLALLPWTPLPGLACAFLVRPGGTVELPWLLLGTTLQMDATGALFLGLCAFLWACAGLYSLGYLRGKPRARSFCVFWQLTLAGSLGVCIAGDVVGFYAFFACLSLAAYGLVIYDRSAAALGAGRVYIALAVLGETALLLGLMLGAQAAGSLRIDDVRAAVSGSSWADAAMLGLIAGLGLKAGLLPLHGWLPLAHTAAPVPASAVLSGAIVKAGIVGLLRLLPMDGSLPGWGQALVVLGLVTAYAGVLLGLAQRQPKAVLAYSTMSQMGLLVALLGAGVAGAAGVGPAAGLQALHHGLAKAGLFLSVGLLAGGGGMRAGVLAAAALLGASMAGLPLSGGALAKLSAKAPLGAGLAADLAAAAAVGTMLLVLRFLVLAHRQAQQPAQAVSPAPHSVMATAFALVVAAAALVPAVWSSYAGGPGLADAREGGALLAAAWPIALALALAAVAWRWRWAVPQVPVGDVAAWGARERPVGRT